MLFINTIPNNAFVLSSCWGYSYQSLHIQGVSRLVDITAGGDFLGLCDEKIHINMCPILDGYGVMTV
jgi:hypothetical protein